jgi:hypothetical protein
MSAKAEADIPARLLRWQIKKLTRTEKSIDRLASHLGGPLFETIDVELAVPPRHPPHPTAGGADASQPRPLRPPPRRVPPRLPGPQPVIGDRPDLHRARHADVLLPRPPHAGLDLDSSSQQARRSVSRLARYSGS